ncbi:MAG: hypothetical protein ACR2Q3_17880 [Woeseiaceae bacterium]
MKSNRLDWRFLGKGTLVPGVSLLIAAIVFAASAWFHGSQARAYEVFSANREAISEDYDELVYRRRLLDRYHRRYRELQELGFVGHERRLDWIETIRAAAKSLDLPNVAYSLEPQLEVIRPVASASPNAEIQIYLSRLELELGLVHELDLLRFFDRLEQEAPGLMQVDQCELIRQPGAARKLSADTNIAANCSMKMFSVITSDISFAATESGR